MTKREENSDQLRQSMAAALIELMQEKPVNEITAQEIVTKAQVGRVTWFRLFHTKEEAISWLLVTMWSAYLEGNGFESRKPTDAENGILFYHFNYENRELMKLIYRQGIRKRWYDEYGVLNIGIIDFLLDDSII